MLNRGQTLFNQGALHEGIYLIESGRIRVFYTAPSGREITLAYWNPGNFVGGPEIFGAGVHLWSGLAATNSSVATRRTLPMNASGMASRTSGPVITGGDSWILSQTALGPRKTPQNQETGRADGLLPWNGVGVAT